MLRMPVMMARPIPIRAYSIPVAMPFRTWPKRSGALRAGLQRADVLAAGVFRGQRRRSRGDDVREVHGVLHGRLGLAPHEEVGTQRLVRLGIDAHLAHEVVDLEPLEGLDDLHVVGG